MLIIQTDKKKEEEETEKTDLILIKIKEQVIFSTKDLQTNCFSKIKEMVGSEEVYK